MASGSDDDEPERLREHPEIKGMIPEIPGMESKLVSHVKSQEIWSQESSSSDKESLALESIGSSSQEGSGTDKEGGGKDSDKEGRLENVGKKRKLETLPEIAEAAVEEDEEQRKARVWKEWWDRKKKEREETNWDEIDWNEELANLKPLSAEERRELYDSIPSPPADFGKIEGLDPALKRDFVHDVDPELWDKYLQEVKESDGFDVTINPGKTPYLPVRPIKHDAVPEIHQQLIDLVKGALQDEHPGYQFKQIEWVTGYLSAGWVYNVTFLAQGADAPTGKSFQARVDTGIVQNGERRKHQEFGRQWISIEKASISKGKIWSSC